MTSVRRFVKGIWSHCPISYKQVANEGTQTYPSTQRLGAEKGDPHPARGACWTTCYKAKNKARKELCPGGYIFDVAAKQGKFSGNPLNPEYSLWPRGILGGGYIPSVSVGRYLPPCRYLTGYHSTCGRVKVFSSGQPLYCSSGARSVKTSMGAGARVRWQSYFFKDVKLRQHKRGGLGVDMTLRGRCGLPTSNSCSLTPNARSLLGLIKHQCR